MGNARLKHANAVTPMHAAWTDWPRRALTEHSMNTSTIAPEIASHIELDQFGSGLPRLD